MENVREENHRYSIRIKLKNGPSKNPSRAWCRKFTNGLYWLPKSIDKARKEEEEEDILRTLLSIISMDCTIFDVGDSLCEVSHLSQCCYSLGLLSCQFGVLNAGSN